MTTEPIDEAARRQSLEQLRAFANKVDEAERQGRSKPVADPEKYSPPVGPPHVLGDLAPKSAEAPAQDDTLNQ